MRLPFRRREKKPKTRRVRKLRLLGLLTILGLVCGVAFVYGLVTAIASEIPKLSPIRQSALEQDGFIYASDGKTVLTRLRGDQSRVLVESKDINPWMKHAIVAVEDRRFWEHRGVDLRGIGRAVWADIQSKELVQGGSTITQQFVKNSLDRDDRTISRKLKEAALAWQLERKWSKDRILTAYLNTVFFGNGAYGVQMAARVYFNKKAYELTLPEAALLAGIPANPSLYNPVVNPKTSRARRSTVLRLMYQQKMITAGEMSAADHAPLPKPAEVRLPGSGGPASYFVEYVKQQLIDTYGPAEVFGGGLKVTTTIDLDLQLLARRTVNEVLGEKGKPSAALVAIDPRDGRVLAMYGGRSFRESQFNLAVQGERQPGSVVQAVRARRRAPRRDLPADDLRVRAAAHQHGRQALVGEQLRGLVPRADRPLRRDHALGQRRLRAADGARRAEEGRADGAPAGDHEPARRVLRDRARRRGREPARDGPRVLDVRERRRTGGREHPREPAARGREHRARREEREERARRATR